MIIEDDEDDFLIISNLIHNIHGRSFTMDWCYRHESALEDMRLNSHDLYFVDYKLGAKTGLDVLKDAVATQCNAPIIMLTGMGNRELDMEAMAAGATDYLIKSELTTDKLERSIRYAMERAATLKSLRQNEKKFREIFQKSKDAIFIADEHFYFKEVNHALTKLLGYDTGQILRLGINDLVAEKEKKDIISQQLDANTEVFDVELELSGAAKGSIQCLLSASVLYDDKGQKYIQGIIRDVSDLKKAERAHLQAEKWKATNRLLRMLAHEVRNPLTNINIAVDMIETEKNEDNQQRYIDIVRRSSERINQLISELLNSSLQSSLTLEKISLQEIFNQTLDMAADRIGLQGIKVISSFPQEQAIVAADVAKLRIALLNIIINAIEAISHHEGVLHIKVENTKKTYEATIEDNGSGISEENLSRLFEPFFTSKRNGIGLGLASALAILQSHKIDVDVKTKLGQGTHFLMSIPKP